MGRKSNKNTTDQIKQLSSKWSFVTKGHLKDCFSSEIIYRGMNYQKTGRVLEISFEGDKLKGVVKGTRKYKVVVSMSNADEISDDQSFICLESICNCPYRIHCKHGVAVLAELIENRGNIHSINKSGNKEVSGEVKKFITPETDHLILKHLAGFKKDELTAEILKLLKLQPQKYEDLMIKLCASSNDLDLQQIQFVNLVERLERYSKDNSEEYHAIMANVISLMKVLLEQKQFNVVIIGAKSILTSRFKQYRSTSSGLTMLNKTAELIPILNEAIEKAKMPMPARFLFWLELILWETTGKLIKNQETIGSFKRDHSFWQSVAADVKKVFEKRLGEHPKDRDILDYQRVLDDLMPELLRYDQKGLAEELLRQEMAKSQSDTRLRQFYKATKDDQRLREHIIKKYNQGFDHAFLHHKLHAIRELILMDQENGDHESVLGLYIYQFFEIQKNEELLLSLFKAADKIKMKSQVADLLVEHIDANLSPFSVNESTAKTHKIDHARWPIALPLYLRANKPAPRPFYENTNQLIADIYIKSDQAEKLFDFYDKVVSNKNLRTYNAENKDRILYLLTRHFKQKYPEKCIAYFLESLQMHLVQSTPMEYTNCIEILKVLFSLFDEVNKQEQWYILVDNIKDTFHKRKKFKEMLTKLVFEM
ncbi:MAG: SWIM zinc finger domain-containing protein, partial [Isosphaeraceae bacterium]